MVKEIAVGAFWTLVAPLGEPLALTIASPDLERQSVLLRINRLNIDQKPIREGSGTYRLSAPTARHLGAALINAAKAVDAIAIPESVPPDDNEDIGRAGT